MTPEQRSDLPALSPQQVRAIDELQHLVKERYPEATFAVSRAEDDPEAIHLDAIVDRDDPDEVVDAVLDRMLEFQLDEGIPVYVIPLRSPAREAALMRRMEHDRRAGVLPPSSL